MRFFSIPAVLTLVAVIGLHPATAWAQSRAGGPLQDFVEYLKFNPLLGAAIMLALTLLLGKGLDYLRAYRQRRRARAAGAE